MLNHLNVPFGIKLFLIRCICHILNLIAQDGLTLAKNQIANIRYIIAYI